MKFLSSKNLIAFVVISVVAFVSFACQKTQTNDANAATTATNAETIKAASPTEAYRLLFAAVKAKDTGKIKQLMSKNTVAFAGFVMEKQKQTMEKTLENGFLETTFAAALPEIRDERVKDNFGAVEVFNEKTQKFDDTYFVNEDGGWKLAVGDAFNGSYKSPGKGRAQIEMEASNPMMTNSAPGANGKFPPTNMGNVKTVEIPMANANKNSANANKK